MMILISALLTVPAFATSGTTEDILKVARMNITMYGFYRIGELGTSDGQGLSEKQICGLAGQAFTAFGVMKAAGLSDQEMSEQLGGLAQFGITLAVVQSQLATDMDDCTR